MTGCTSRLVAAPIALAALIVMAAVPATAHADAPLDRPAAFHADIEIDPTAYVLEGNSLHVGIGWRSLRVDLGNFAIAMPQFVHGDDGFDVRFDGYGAKLQWFPFAEQRGLFVGVDAGVARVHIDRQDSDRSVRQTQIGAGVHVGYRISLPAGFYATPWIGVGFQTGADDVTIDGATYEGSALSVFPAIHLGYQFR